MNKYLQQTEKEEVKNWINTTLKKYLSKNEEKMGEVEHILDFLNSDQAPVRLRKMSYAQAKDGAAKWMRTLTKRGKNIDENEKEDYKTVKRFRDGFSLVLLISKKSYEREGNLMKHCVSSYYGKPSKIYSLRDADNMPHCTFEVLKDGDQIQQLKGKGNGHIHPKYIQKVMTILKYFKLEVRDSEMENLGYSKLDDGELKWVKTNFEGIKLFKKFIYNNAPLGSK